MKILFVPPSPKAGTTEHCENAAGRALILAGFAQEVKYNDFRERLAAEGTPKAEKPVTEWAVIDADGSAWSVVRVCKKVGSTTTFYSAPPEDAPRVVVEKFDLLTNAVKNDPAEALAKAKREAAEYNEKIKFARKY